jgi:hypothetical protein
MSIDWKSLDYSKMICNPMVVPDKKSPEDHYEIFKRYREFIQDTPGINRNKLFRYIPLVYDKHSPLREHIDDIRKLKGKAAELAGFRRTNDRYSEQIEILIACKNSTVNSMIIRYVTLHKNKLYHRYVVLNEMYDNMSIRLLESQASKAEIEAFGSLGDQIDEITQELLSKDVDLQESFEEYYLENQLRMRPEDVAERILEGEDI